MRDTSFRIMRTEMTEARFEMCDKKGVEYTRGSDDRHANFKRIAQLLDLSPVEVLLVYLQKHIDAIYHGIRTKEEGTERLEDRIKDALNYLDLLYGLIKEDEVVTETRIEQEHGTKWYNGGYVIEQEFDTGATVVKDQYGNEVGRYHPNA